MRKTRIALFCITSPVRSQLTGRAAVRQQALKAVRLLDDIHTGTRGEEETMRRAILAGVVSVVLALTALPASARGTTVYRSPELRVTESITGGATTWTFLNRTDHSERVTCRWMNTVILTNGDTIEDHTRWTTTLDASGRRSKRIVHGEGVVSVRSSNWSCAVR
jgi:hypothetical protein